MSEPVRFYVNPAWRREEASHIPLLFPFWGKKFWKNVMFTSGIFDTFSFDTNEYAITDDISSSYAILLPYRFDIAMTKFPALVQEIETLSEKSGKPVVIDAVGDGEYAVPLKSAIVLRYGGYRFLKKNNEIIVPPYADDLLLRYQTGMLTFREKGTKPVIGFVGWARMPFVQSVRSMLRDAPQYLRGLFNERYRACRKGIFFRKKALTILEASDLIEPNFLIRDSYSGNVKTAPKDAESLRSEFVENAMHADFALDIRGDANASTRLFEMLSLGRVPLIIDTERNFPFSENIDYRSFSIIVDHTEMARMPEIVRSAYDALSPEEWRLMQERARAAYLEYFRVDAMTKHLMHAIRQKIDAL